MKQQIVTGLNFDRSKRALSEAFASYAKQFAQYNPTFSWKTNALAEFGFNSPVGKMGGHILVDDGCLVVDMNVPLFARPFQGKAIEVIEKEVKVWVEKIKMEG